MAVVVETTIGDFTIDLFVDNRPQVCKNFLKLCKMKYYNFCLFHSVQPNFLAQTGDPSGVGSGGESIYGLLYGENERFFEGEVMPKIKHSKPGLLSMVNCGNNMLGSQFFITLGEELVSLDSEHCVFGEISEGIEIIHKLNEAICDTQHRPYKDIRITHTVILEDPFEDPSGLIVPDMSPEATQERLANGRIGADEKVDETAGLSSKEIEELKEEREAKARATILEIVGDLPDAEIAPPENVLFVCKLNPVTTDNDLSIIFNRFGKIKSCEIIRDKTTGDSLQYGFIEFEDQKSCEDAYFKMSNVLIDDRRIKVDFSQSVAKEYGRWRGKGRGIEHIKPENHIKDREIKLSNHKEREESRTNRRDKDHEENQRRRERGKDRENDRYSRERGRDKFDERRSRGRQEREHKRDRSRSGHRRLDSKYRRDDPKDDSKRYDSSRKERGSSRKRDDDSRRTSSSRKSDEKRRDDRKLEEYNKDKEKKYIHDKVSNNNKHEKVNAFKRQSLEKIEIKDSEERNNLRESSPVARMNTSTSEHNEIKEFSAISGGSEKVLNVLGADDLVKEERKLCTDSPKSSRSDRREHDLRTGEEEAADQSHENDREINEFKDKKKVSKRKRKSSENIKKKRRRCRNSSSSDSSSESSDSSESTSSSDSSDYRHSKKKKLIIAKKYYRGGKLVKEVKKKRKTRDSSESESFSDESTDSDSKRKNKYKKLKKSSESLKLTNKKSDISSDENSPSESSSDESNSKMKRKRKQKIDRYSKKKSKQILKKKKNRRKETSSSSDSEHNEKKKAYKKMKKTVKS